MSLFFDHPGVFTAWGLKNGELDAAQLAQRAKAAGLAWICQEVGDPSTEPTQEQLAALRTACAQSGLYFGVWEVDPVNLSLVKKFRPNFWVPNVEHPGNYTNLLRAFREAYPRLPAAVITNDDMDFRPWLKANIRCIPEAYMNDNPGATPWNMCQRSRQQGYTYVFPCFGVYHDYPLAAYEPYLPSHQPPKPVAAYRLNGWSIYLAEGMTEADWKTLASWHA